MNSDILMIMNLWTAKKFSTDHNGNYGLYHSKKKDNKNEIQY